MAERGQKDLRNIRLANYFQDVETAILSNIPELIQDGVEVVVKMKMKQGEPAYYIGRIKTKMGDLGNGGKDIDWILQDLLSRQIDLAHPSEEKPDGYQSSSAE